MNNLKKIRTNILILILTAIAATLNTSSLFSMSIFEAMKEDDPKIVESFFLKNNLKINAPINVDFNTPLAEGPYQGLTPLYVACYQNKLPVVKYLLQKNATK